MVEVGVEKQVVASCGFKMLLGVDRVLGRYLFSYRLAEASDVIGPKCSTDTLHVQER